MKRLFSVCCLIAALLQAPLVYADITSNLVVWLKLDDGSGTSAADATGNKNTGTLVNTPSWIAGQIGSGALSFTSGSNQYVTIAHTTGLPIYSTSGYSIAFWVKGAASANSVFSEGSNGTNQNVFWFAGNASGKLDVYLRGDTTEQLAHVVSTTTIFDSTWRCVVWTDNNGTATLYVGGSADATNFNYTPEHTDLNLTTLAALRRTDLSNYGTVSLDEVRMFSRVLSSGDVTEYCAYTGGTPPAATRRKAILIQ